MTTQNSVSQWIASLRAGDLDAVQKLWDRYIGQLVELARKRMRGMPARVSDEEDVAQSVFLALCRGASAGRFDDVRNRDELWWLLLAITRQKLIDLVRREMALKRGAGQVKCEAALAGESGNFDLDLLIGEAPTPELLATIDEETRLLLGKLRDDRLRQIAVARIEGYTVPEIAELLGISTRSVERKLQLIRNTWARELSVGEQDARTR